VIRLCVRKDKNLTTKITKNRFTKGTKKIKIASVFLGDLRAFLVQPRSGGLVVIF